MTALLSCTALFRRTLYPWSIVYFHLPIGPGCTGDVKVALSAKMFFSFPFCVAFLLFCFVLPTKRFVWIQKKKKKSVNAQCGTLASAKTSAENLSRMEDGVLKYATLQWRTAAVQNWQPASQHNFPAKNLSLGKWSLRNFSSGNVILHFSSVKINIHVTFPWAVFLSVLKGALPNRYQTRNPCPRKVFLQFFRGPGSLSIQTDFQSPPGVA